MKRYLCPANLEESWYGSLVVYTDALAEIGRVKEQRDKALRYLHANVHPDERYDVFKSIGVYVNCDNEIVEWKEVSSDPAF